MLNQFQSLDHFLLDTQTFWRFEPFFRSIEPTLPWREDNRELCTWLASLPAPQIEFYKQNTQALVADIAPYLPCVAKLESWLSLPQQARQGLTLKRGIASGIPGRKLEQILSMGGVAIADHQGSEWLEWCSGKGFLGRVLSSQTQQKVTSFEYQSKLCQVGQQEADKHQLAMNFVQGDALGAQACEVFNDKQHAVALHACGDLHISLLKHASEKQLAAITLSPCCYHLTKDHTYQALSQQGRLSTLGLTRQELRIPLQETVTGGARVKQQRMTEMIYRLGFDLLLRQLNPKQGYQPVPSIKKSQLSQGFTAFCHWASNQKGIALPKLDFDHYHKLGEQRYWQMERLSLVQAPFRRALELWLALDKVLYLQQQGYQVTLSEFCAREITPRNLLIHAVKK